MEIRFDSRFLSRFRHTRNDAARMIHDNGIRFFMDSGRLDADETYFFARQLEWVKKQTKDVLYPEFKGSWICPVSNEADTGTETITYGQYEGVGKASVVDRRTKDYKKVEIRKKEFSQPVRTLAMSIDWSLQELRNDAMRAKNGNTEAGKSATERKTDWAIKGIREKEEEIIAKGDSDFGLIGFYNNSNIYEMSTGATVDQIKADGTGNKANWLVKDADKIIRDFNQIVNYVPTQTKGVHTINTVLMTNGYYARIATLRIPNTNTSVLAYLKSVHPDKEIVAYDRVNLAAAGYDSGTPTEDWIIAYHRAPTILQQEIPQVIEVLPPLQTSHEEFESAVRERHGGILIYYPKACVRAKITR